MGGLEFIEEEKYGNQKKFLGFPIMGDESSLQGYVEQGYIFKDVAFDASNI